MKNEDTWTDEKTGTEMVVIGTYWKREKRDEDAARTRSRFAGTVVLTDDPNPIYTELEDFKTTFLISVPKADHAAGANALYGI